jgi:hypothetical protein
MAFIFIINACQFTHQQKGEKLVKDYLNDHLNDPSSYQSMSFSKIDTNFKKYEYSDPQGIDYRKKYDDIQLKELEDENLMDKELKKESMNWTNYYRWEKESKTLSAQIKKWDSFFEDRNKGYKGPIKDFVIIHTYRAKNGFGALGIETTAFTIDSAFTKVTDSETMKN